MIFLFMNVGRQSISQYASKKTLYGNVHLYKLYKAVTSFAGPLFINMD